MTATRYAGQRIARVEDARLLTGRGTFVDDISRPGMLHACFVRSPFARAHIRGVDASAAVALPGVRAVFTAADLNPDVREQWFTMMGKNLPTTPLPPLAEGEARFAGDPVALVVAQSRAVAEDAAELVDVDFEPLTPVVDYRDAEQADALVHDGYAGNVVGRLAFRPPDEEAFAAAALVVRETIAQQAYAAVPMETRGIVAEWTPASGELTIWSATQAPHEVRSYCARLLGLAESRIRVIMRDTGGGFGQKVNVSREEMCIMLAARKVPAALKWVEDRRENLMSAGQARHEHGDARFAFADDGTILAAHVDHVIDVGAYPIPWPVGTGAAAGMLFPGPYRVPAATFSTTCLFTNTVGRTAYRGPWQFESLAREMMLDIAARRMGIDPVELRRRNLLRHDELPYANANGMTYDSVT
ncbi:MAG: molybdopterin cofactor-binding domain-containing protein, partial [Acidimicrobiia bacterium]